MFNKAVLPLFLSFLFGLTFPPVAVLVLFRLASSFSNIHVPIWVVVLLALLSSPITLATRGYLKLFRDRHDAALMGAVLPPLFKGTWPGNVNLIINSLSNFHVKYLGHLLYLPLPPYNLIPCVGDDWREKDEYLGRCHTVSILWKNVVLTTEPEHIKVRCHTQFLK
jgi:hypothetical protein